MKNLIFLTALFISFSTNVIAQIIPVPNGYSVLDTITGDLDKDNISELVVAYNTGDEDDDVIRSLIIYKINNGVWKSWKQSDEALLTSRGGGVFGDPYQGIKIERGILIIYHYGGSNWKWSTTDKYRYQNGEFYLIGYTNTDGRPCDYWQTFDFNLSTGRINFEKIFEKCGDDYDVTTYKKEKETFYKRNLKITLQNRQNKSTRIITPKYKEQLYL
ncbi:MAG: hypothetical protein N4A72_23265 [Bacteroidales bacterium]|jgi:hypothetical protein|nr:hypothetical protein [Bacteroidales bacterium]